MLFALERMPTGMPASASPKVTAPRLPFQDGLTSAKRRPETNSSRAAFATPAPGAPPTRLFVAPTAPPPAAKPAFALPNVSAPAPPAQFGLRTMKLPEDCSTSTPPEPIWSPVPPPAIWLTSAPCVPDAGRASKKYAAPMPPWSCGSVATT